VLPQISPIRGFVKAKISGDTFILISHVCEDCFSDMLYVLATQVNDQKIQRQLTTVGFIVITQR